MSSVYCQICCVFTEFVFANHYEICQGLQMYFFIFFCLWQHCHTLLNGVQEYTFEFGCITPFEATFTFASCFQKSNGNLFYFA